MKKMPASIALVAAVIATLAPATPAQEIPQQLQPPQNETLLLDLHAKGDQIYTCKNNENQFTWTLKAPDAQLFDKNEKPAGKHFGGPSWQLNDGSKVTGKAIANVPSPDGNSIPWLLVKVTTHEGKGALESVTTIQRVNTKGGKAPASGCDAANADKELRVPYTATYKFYAPK